MSTSVRAGIVFIPRGVELPVCMVARPMQEPPNHTRGRSANGHDDVNAPRARSTASVNGTAGGVQAVYRYRARDIGIWVSVPAALTAESITGALPKPYLCESK
jgi:hypothetical protein